MNPVNSYPMNYNPSSMINPNLTGLTGTPGLNTGINPPFNPLLNNRQSMAPMLIMSIGSALAGILSAISTICQSKKGDCENQEAIAGNNSVKSQTRDEINKVNFSDSDIDVDSMS
jgi:hypothetical protein